MRTSKFTDEQIVRALRDADATSTAAAAKKIGVSEQTLYVWRRKFRDASVDEVRQLKAVVEENNTLKKLLAEQLLAIAVLKEVNSKKW